MEIRLIDEEEVPTKVKMTAQAAIDLLNRIPKGKAMVTTEKELGVRGTSLKSTVDRLMKKNRIPNEYRVVQRTKRDPKHHNKPAVFVYIIHSAKAEVKAKPIDGAGET